MGHILEIGFFFWLGAAATTLVIMGTFSAVCMIRKVQLPEQDIPYWQGLLIYLPVEAIPAAVFALTAAISSTAGIFPLINYTGSELVSLIAAGGIQVVVTVIALSGHDKYQRQQKEQRLLVQEQRPGSPSRMAISTPVLVFLILPVVLYYCLHLVSI